MSLLFIRGINLIHIVEIRLPHKIYNVTVAYGGHSFFNGIIQHEKTLANVDKTK